MIRSISLENFKLFRKKTVFGNLTSINILTGVNGRGKSTLLQALLLPRQSLIDSMWTHSFLLNGSLVKLGNAIDVKNENASRLSDITFGYESDSENVVLHMSAPTDSAQKLELREVLINGASQQDLDELPLKGFIPNSSDKTNSEFRGLISSLKYISADRIGPELRYNVSKDTDNVDSLGEYTACVLHTHKDDSIDEALIDHLFCIFPGLTETDTQDITDVKGMVDFWMTQMFGRTKIRTEFIASVNLYSLNYTVNNNKEESKPTNIGYGYSYVLPIFVAGLTAKRGQILIIENPEAHLHPKAQSILGKFLAWISVYGGVQVFVETHSEHVVNSFRVMMAQKIVKSKDVNIMFFDDDFPEYYRHIKVDDVGQIQYWPSRFFDQEEIDLNVLL